MKRLVALVAAVVLAALGASPAQAHGGSYDMKYVDGSNVLLLTFNTHAPVSGLAIEHDLRLYDLLGAPLTYDDVSVEVHTRDTDGGATLRGESLLLEETVPMLPTNESKLTVTYPTPGAYSVRAVFSADGREISRGEFAVDVGTGTAATGGFPWVRLGLTLLLGLFVGSLLPRGGAASPVGPRGEDRDGGTRPEPAPAPAGSASA